MLYTELSPPPALQNVVEKFWHLCNTKNGHGVSRPRQPERILPDGRMEIILNRGLPFSELRPDGRRTQQPESFIVGQLERPLFVLPSEPAEIFGIRLRPWGAAALLRAGAASLSGQTAELGCVAPSLARQLRAALESSPHARSVFAALARILQDSLSRASRNTPAEASIANVVREIALQAGVVSISQLARQAGLSLRQFERRFAAVVGLPPKRFAALLRFQRVFRAVESEPEWNWTDVALECGYYDQAHLLRDFRRYAGMTPAAVLRLEGSLTHVFLRNLHRNGTMSHSSNPPRIGTD